MSEIVNEDNPRVIPPDAPLGAHELVKAMPYGPVNAVEASYESSDVKRLDPETGDFVTVEEADRGEPAVERVEEDDRIDLGDFEDGSVDKND